MKVTFLAIILPAMVFGQDVLWSDDKSTNAFNCDGFVTDAICCQDDLCNGQDENSCNSDPKTSLFCKWDRFFSKCLAFRDVENNVCCQSKPVAGCSDLMKGVCPAHFQVPENCCSNDGKKWKDLFRGVRPGHVCCNAPCNEMKSNQCPLPDHCKKLKEEVWVRTERNKPRLDLLESIRDTWIIPILLENITATFMPQLINSNILITLITKLLKSPLMTSLTC